MTTVVVGGGLGGSLVARAIQVNGGDVMVVDAEDEPGGIAATIREQGYLLEPAAGTVLLPHPALDPLLAGLDVILRPVGPAARRRFVRHRGRTVELRPGPGVLATPLVSTGAKLRLALEPFVQRGRGDESLEQFLVRRLGRETGQLAAWLMAAGVHAGDPRNLSADDAFPALSALEHSHGSLLRGALARRRSAGVPSPSTHVVEGGTAGIASAVAGSLDEKWRQRWPVQRLEPGPRGWRVHGPDVIDAERVVTAVSPEALGAVYPAVADRAEDWERAPVAVVWLGLTAPLPDGLGVLIGPDEGFVSLGFLYESSYSPERAPAGRGLVKAIVGGAVRPDVVDLPDPELVDRVSTELARVLGTEVEIEMSHVIRHRPGIPQYTAGHATKVQALRQALPPGLAVAGWCYDGVGVSQLATAAYRYARQP